MHFSVCQQYESQLRYVKLIEFRRILTCDKSGFRFARAALAAAVESGGRRAAQHSDPVSGDEARRPRCAKKAAGVVGVPRFELAGPPRPCGEEARRGLSMHGKAKIAAAKPGESDRVVGRPRGRSSRGNRACFAGRTGAGRRQPGSGRGAVLTALRGIIRESAEWDAQAACDSGEESGR